MSDVIQTMTARLAADPSSLEFLPLGEVLRRRGQFEAALTVALRGVSRHPALADAHDLVARIRSDRGEGDLAFDAWTVALRLDPEHVGALRGLAFLAFRAGDLDRALRHLEAAVARAPEDPALLAALDRVRARRREAPRPPAGPPAAPDGPGTLLVDLQGRRLSGRVTSAAGADVSDPVAAAVSTAAREAERAARLLGLGSWRAVSVEAERGPLHLMCPTPDSVLLAVGEPGAPSGRLALLAERAAASARRWMERLA